MKEEKLIKWHIKWRSVENELPELYEPVLTCHKSKYGISAKKVRARLEDGWIDDHFEFCPNSNVTHWIWLPELPDESEESDE